VYVGFGGNICVQKLPIDWDPASGLFAWLGACAGAMMPFREIVDEWRAENFARTIALDCEKHPTLMNNSLM